MSEQKIVLITGCSSGFGLIMATHLAACGHKVIATMRSLEKETDLLSKASELQVKIETLHLDVTNNESISVVKDHLTSKYGHLDVLINNAGFGMAGFFEDLTENDIREQMETNFFGVQNVTRQMLPLLKQKPGSKIINISSVSGFTASPAFSAYCTSKWALEAFSECLRLELKFFGIDVLLIEPGSYITKIFSENARLATNFYNKESQYYNLSCHLKNTIDVSLSKNTKDPQDIAKLAEKLINQKNPPFRNIPDFSSKLLYIFRKYSPFWLYSWIIEKVMLQKCK